MNNCSKYIEQMNMYLDGELKGSKISELLEHIERCPNCKKRFESLKIISFQTREMDVSIPGDLHDKIMRNARTNSRPAKQKFGMRKFMPLAAVAAVFLILVTSTFGGPVSSFLSFNFASEEANLAAPGANVKAAAFTAESGQTAPAGGVQQTDSNEPSEESTADADGVSPHNDEEFAFLKLFSGKGELPSFIAEHKYVQDPDSQLYYVYIENSAEAYGEFENKLKDAGLIDGGELNNASGISEDASNVLYIINMN